MGTFLIIAQYGVVSQPEGKPLSSGKEHKSNLRARLWCLRCRLQRDVYRSFDRINDFQEDYLRFCGIKCTVIQLQYISASLHLTCGKRKAVGIDLAGGGWLCRYGASEESRTLDQQFTKLLLYH